MTDYLISYSRVQAYRDCPYKHFLAYVKNLEKIQPARALYFGSDFHKLLAVRHEPDKIPAVMAEIKDGFYSAPPSEQDKYGDNYIEDIEQIFSDYCYLYPSDGASIINTEIEFEFPLVVAAGNTGTFKGFTDELLKMPDGKIWIGEHKTFTRAPDPLNLQVNVQKCIYKMAVQEQLEIDAVGVRWDYIKSTPASEPVWLEKSQRFSSAASQQITPMSYLRACRKHLINTELLEVQEQAQTYQNNVENFFFRKAQKYIPEMVDKIWKDFKKTAREIISVGEKNRVKYVGMQCSWCDYRPICYAQLTGVPFLEVVDKDYRKKGEFR